VFFVSFQKNDFSSCTNFTRVDDDSCATIDAADRIDWRHVVNVAFTIDINVFINKTKFIINISRTDRSGTHRSLLATTAAAATTTRPTSLWNGRKSVL
jgi:hypothetical protein